MNRLRSAVFAAVLLAGGYLPTVGIAQGATITFETSPTYGTFSGSVTEDGFTYSKASGGLFLSLVEGNPGRTMQGQAANGGGVLSIVAAAGEPSTFVFSGLDYGAFNTNSSGAQVLSVSGLLGGSVVGTESYSLASNRPMNWTTFAANNLAGVEIDELRITLAGSVDLRPAIPVFTYQSVDNIVLAAAPNAVPTPGTAALVATGMLGLALTRRRRSRC